MKKLPQIETVTVEELAFAYAVGSNAASGAIPQSGVKGMGVNLEMDDGDIHRIELTDTPLNRAAIAIRDQFPKGKLQPIMLRIMALQEMSALPDALSYIRDAEDKPGESEISEAMFRIAAEMPLNHKLSFNRATFFKRVAKAYKEDPD